MAIPASRPRTSRRPEPDPDDAPPSGRGRSLLLGVGAAFIALSVLVLGGTLGGRPQVAGAQDDGNTLAAGYVPTWSAHHQAAPNPALVPGCGLDIGLLVDRSGSITIAGAEQQMRGAAKTFVNALAGTPSRIGLWTFGWSSSSTPGDPEHPSVPLTDVGGLDGRAGVTALATAVDSIPVDRIAPTNWDMGFRAVHDASMRTGEPPDLLIVLTDGQPTVWGEALDPEPNTDDADIDAGIASANLVKSDGTRVFAVGIGANIDRSALSLITGGTPWDGSNFPVADYALTSFDRLAATLRAAVTDVCGGTVTVRKVIDDGTGVRTPGGDWAFGFGAPDDPTWTTVAKTDAGGLAQFEHPSIDPRRVAVAEVAQAGYELQVDGISCTDAAGPNPVLERRDDGVSFVLGPTAVITCVFPNLRLPEPTTSTTSTTAPSTPSTTVSPPTTETTPTTDDTVAPTTTAPVDDGLPAGAEPQPPTEVLGVVQSRPSATAGTLPRTGADHGRLAVSGVSLMAGGALMVLGLRRRQDEAAS